MIHAEAELRELLGTLSPLAREHLRNVLIREHADRDAIASQLLRHDENGQGWATSSTCCRYTRTRGDE
jgi:hypothetical protein